ncbi:MMPL family transporter [Lactobacillus delbrueckii subsp. lactis]|uniref:MMPL family transporter n=1 Tax=Lactobacillus delbrueckii TaxID=1584 RepID=UPI001E4A6978|nr:MMPL family transporter [Lactobacillus delbrueckii]MCD5559980.1 MMPL family transporter [Lactobacillus delbrueckii subsp. lactis]MCD5571467.1 MMPL family transporter [Lactobacillus delbrueckii subsp. lactis]MCD5582436.1 MMPL family transporter [Lactobacillus delbrueckii subsp. lactis]MCD5584369.1 MMPL family transporter [Lactobacillus delbrueckii subsp. lactis]MCD5592745.1 MMPL family transporter [Lactobacillus delbrueckii subsp. lactis]
MKKLLKNHLGALIAWVLILVISLVALPNVESLTRAHSEISLPSNVESEAAKLIKNEWGSKKKNTYEVAVVFNKKSGKLTETDQGNIEASIDRLTSNQKKYGIKDYLAPQDNIATKKLLKSKDGTTWVMQMNIAKSHGTISQVNDEINKAVKTSGVRTYVTGADVLNNDFTSSIREGIKKTELITVVFIFIVLIIVFRSPVVPLVSLLTVGVSFLVSFSIVTNLVNQVNFPFSNFTQVFMVIVLFGIGTDYNILLYNHFKEDLGNGLGVAEATKDSIKKAGRTILYSGSSILIGFSALGLANFSVYRSASGVAVGVLVLLIVLLTLNPFFMATLGKKMFWPSKEVAGENPSKMWHGISSATLKRPVVFLAAVAVVVTPFFVTYSNVLNYDDTAEISDSVPSKQGLNLVQKHFSKGMAMPSYLYIKSDHTLDNEKDLKMIDELTRKLRNSEGVDKVMSATEPYNEKIKLLYVKKQLKSVTDGTAKLEKGVGKLTKGSEQVTSGAKKLANGADQLDEGTGTLSDGAKNLYTGTVKLYNGSIALYDGAGTLFNGTKTLSVGADALYSGTRKLSSGANTLSAGTQKLKSGTSSLASGSQTLANGTGSLATGAQKLYTGTKTLTRGAQDLTDNMSNLVSGLDQLKSELSAESGSLDTSKLDQLSEGLTKLNTGLQQLNGVVSQINVPNIDTSKISSLVSGLQSLQGQVSNLKKGLTDTQSGLTTAVTGLGTASAAAGSLASSISKISDPTLKAELQKELETLNSGLSSTKSGLGTAGSGLTTAGTAATNMNSAASGIQSAAGSLGSSTSAASTADLSTEVQQLQAIVSQLASGSNDLSTQAASGVSGAAQLANGARRLTSGAGQLQSGASQLQNGLAQGVNGSSQLAEGADKLQSGTSQLSSGASKLAEKTPAITSGLTAVNNGLVSAGSYLNGLRKSKASDTFYVPSYVLKHNADLQKSLKVFLSPDKKSAMIIIILDSNPSSESAAEHSQALSAMARKSLKGTDLGKAEVEMGGQSSTIEDTKNTASGDFTRTMAIMLIGVGIALILITRSLLQPIYILGTLLLAYISSLSITRWVVSGVMGRSTLAWNVPFFTFIMLIALGVDYSIFVMMRYRDSDPHALPSARILKACTAIGTVVISAVVILGGTFAALIPSGVPTLIEVAIGVIIGLAILIFLMPINLSASTKLTYEGFPWPKWAGRKKGLSFGKKS